jgi:hypothetical protein
VPQRHGLAADVTRALLAAATAALTVAAGASAAAPKPDAHDRALVSALNAKVATFRQISGGPQDESTQLDKCPVIKKDPSQALAAVFLLLPVLLTEVVNGYGAQIKGLRDTMASMHPDSALFAKWLAAEKGSLDLLLQFDNHGKKVDLCNALQVLQSKSSTDADIYRATGIHAVLIAKLFGDPATATLSKLNPRMRPFLVAAGLSVKDAKALTSTGSS